MSFDWPEFLTLAEELVESAPLTVSDEARWRAAIGRSYYAAYHAAQTRTQRAGYRPPGNVGVHEGLIRYYLAYPATRWQEIGVVLGDLRELRVKADYQRFPRSPLINQNTARLHVELVRGLLDDLSHL